MDNLKKNYCNNRGCIKNDLHVLTLTKATTILELPSPRYSISFFSKCISVTSNVLASVFALWTLAAGPPDGGLSWLTSIVLAFNLPCNPFISTYLQSILDVQVNGEHSGTHGTLGCSFCTIWGHISFSCCIDCWCFNLQNDVWLQDSNRVESNIKLFDCTYFSSSSLHEKFDKSRWTTSASILHITSCYTILHSFFLALFFPFNDDKTRVNVHSRI